MTTTTAVTPEAPVETPAKYKNREAWLLKAVEAFKPLLDKAGYPLKKPIYVSVGWPKGRRGVKATAIGQCWPGSLSKDGNGHVFISPSLVDSTRVLDVLLHEVGHDIVGCEHGHKKPFADFCKAVGLLKPWTATTASPELQARLERMVQRLGPYPHAALGTIGEGGGLKKQTTRMRKYTCEGCGQIVRAAKDDLQITCTPCGQPFTREETKE